MPAPQELAMRLESLDSVDITVHDNRCVRVRNRHAGCDKCAQACTSGCITFEGNEIRVDATRCTGCGTCCTACPTCALEATNPNDATLLAQALKVLAAGDGRVAIAAAPLLERRMGAYDPAKVLAVPNLGRVEETLLVRLAALGARELTLVVDVRADEAQKAGEAMAGQVCDSANALLAAWGSTARISLSSDFPQACAPSDALGACAPQVYWHPHDTQNPAHVFSQGPGAYRRMKVMRDGTLPHFMPDRREALAQALFDIGEPAAGEVRTRLWGHAVIDAELCRGCRLCATFCPTGALSKFADEQGRSGVEHTPADCVKCLCCQDVCRYGAIRVLDDVDVAAIAGGTSERFYMPDEAPMRSNSKSIINAVRKMTKTDRIYER